MKLGARSLLTCSAVLAAVAALPVSGASASNAHVRSLHKVHRLQRAETKASRKAAVKAALSADNAQIAAADAKVLQTVEQYASSKNAAAAQAAIQEELTALQALSATVKAVKIGGHPLVKFGKDEVLAGLRSVIAAYEHLGAGIATSTIAPKVAVTQYKRSQVALARARREITRGEAILTK